MRTTRENVYAAGDVVRAHNPTAGRALAVEHWGEALNMGEIAGRNAAGEDRVWDVAPGFWSTIGTRTLKYAAWGDGFDEARMVEHGHDAFTVWYGRDGVTVGVLAHDRDEDYERGRTLVETGAPLP
jgi:NADPH-dependent 2,4-dienoyl-CoA reductase/sulfur reductase-like enzyme